MRKITIDDLKGKDLFVDDDGRIIVRNRVSNKKFMPSTGQYYFVSHEGRVYGHDCDNSIYDCILRDRDYVFKTKNDAKEYAKYLKALKKYRYEFTADDFENEDIKKYYLYYNGIDDFIGFDFEFIRVNNKVLFETKDACKDFIKEVGKENIKRFMFDIWGDEK